MHVAWCGQKKKRKKRKGRGKRRENMKKNVKKKKELMIIKVGKNKRKIIKVSLRKANPGRQIKNESLQGDKQSQG